MHLPYLLDLGPYDIFLFSNQQNDDDADSHDITATLTNGKLVLSAGAVAYADCIPAEG